MVTIESTSGTGIRGFVPEWRFFLRLRSLIGELGAEFGPIAVENQIQTPHWTLCLSTPFTALFFLLSVLVTLLLVPSSLHARERVIGTKTKTAAQY